VGLRQRGGWRCWRGEPKAAELAGWRRRRMTMCPPKGPDFSKRTTKGWGEIPECGVVDQEA